MALLSPLSLATKVPAAKLIHQCSSHIPSSTPLDNITLNPANKKADQSLSEFQTGICAVAHVTLDTQQLTSVFAAVDTISSPPDSEGGVIPVSEVHELLIKIHDILNSAMSK